MPIFTHWIVFVSSPEPVGSLMSLKYRHVPSSVRRSPLSVVCPPFSKIFSKTVGPIEAKFHVEPPWVGGTKVCSGYLGHMTKMAVTPIYGKKPSNIFSGTKGPMTLGLGL